VRDKETVKQELLGTFRAAGAGAGALLPPKWLQRHYLPTFAPEEEAAFEQAVRELIDAGLVQYVERGSPNLRLTDKGAAAIR
jgi:hypothetical protein